MKNSKGISLIALIITIIVIIILAAIVIGGVFNTPNDAKFANFCQQYDQLQTAIQLKYYELYQADALNNINKATVKNIYTLYNEVVGGTGEKLEDEWVEVSNASSLTSLSVTGTWYMRLSDGKLVYDGFQKNDTEIYYTPSIHGTAKIEAATDIPGKDTSFEKSETTFTSTTTTEETQTTP